MVGVTTNEEVYYRVAVLGKLTTTALGRHDHLGDNKEPVTRTKVCVPSCCSELPPQLVKSCSPLLLSNKVCIY